jgi:hypothetical protein
MRKPEHVEENLAASGAGPLPESTLNLLACHRWQKNFYLRQ